MARRRANCSIDYRLRMIDYLVADGVFRVAVLIMLCGGDLINAGPYLLKRKGDNVPGTFNCRSKIAISLSVSP